MAQKDRIKAWRKNAGLTQADMMGIFKIPKHTVENWEMGVRECPLWAEELLIDRLRVLAKDRCERAMKNYAKKLGSNAEGIRPKVCWAVRRREGVYEYLDICPNMVGAIVKRQELAEGEIICFLAGKDGEYYESETGGKATEVMVIELPKE